MTHRYKIQTASLLMIIAVQAGFIFYLLNYEEIEDCEAVSLAIAGQYPMEELTAHQAGIATYILERYSRVTNSYAKT